ADVVVLLIRSSDGGVSGELDGFVEILAGSESVIQGEVGLEPDKIAVRLFVFCLELRPKIVQLLESARRSPIAIRVVLEVSQPLINIRRRRACRALRRRRSRLLAFVRRAFRTSYRFSLGARGSGCACAVLRGRDRRFLACSIGSRLISLHYKRGDTQP